MSSTETNKSVNLLKSKYIFSWEVNNFSATKTMEVEESIESEEFTTDGEDRAYHWKLRLFPMGRSINGEKEFSSLFLVPLNDVPVEIGYNLMILDVRNKVARKFSEKREFTSTEGRGFILFRRSVVEVKANRFLINDTLKIVCEIIYAKKIENFESVLQEPSHTNELNTLGHLENLLNQQKFSDVELKVGKRILYAHKSVLSRSPVFAAMFEHDMRENKENEVIITDVEYDVFKEMLRFIYCGKVETIDVVAEELLPVADKYALTDLKRLCEDSLCDDLCLHNVLEMLKFADLYNAVILKEEVKVFMITHAADIVQLPEFKTLKNLEDDVFTEVMKALVLREK